MPIIVQISILFLFLSIPLVFFRFYLETMDENSKNILDSQMNESSESIKDLKVWTKKFELLKKKNKFELDPYQVNYSFNACDLFLNKENFKVIGKSKFFSKKRCLNPMTFEYKIKNSASTTRQVYCADIKENGQDLENEFGDNQYLNNMTFVIKRINNKLIEIKLSITQFKSKPL